MEELNALIERVAQPRTREVFGWMLDYQEQLLDRAEPDNMCLLELNDLIACVAQHARQLKDTNPLEWMLALEEYQDCEPHVGDLMFQKPNDFVERLAA